MVARSRGIIQVLERLGFSITPRLQEIKNFLALGTGRFPSIARVHEKLRLALDAERWGELDFMLARLEDRTPTLEEVVEESGVDKLELIGSIAALGMLLSLEDAKNILSLNLPSVVESVVDEALEGEGHVKHLAQKLVLEASGMVGKQPMVQINNTNQVGVSVGNIPKWEDRMKLVEGIYFGNGNSNNSNNSDNTPSNQPTLADVATRELPPAASASQLPVIDAEVEEVVVATTPTTPIPIPSATPAPPVRKPIQYVPSRNSR